MKITPYLIILSGLCFYSLNAQETIESTTPIRIFGETGVTLSDGENTPFWFTANQFGLASLKRNNAYLRAGAFRDVTDQKKFSWGFGFEMAGCYRYDAAFYIQQAYGEGQYKWLRLTAGSKAYEPDIVDRSLSSGGLVYSGNARPVPQLRLAVPEYTSLGFTNGWIALKGHLAYGMFVDNGFQEDFTAGKADYVKNAFYHSKAGFMRVGRETDWLQFEGGIQFFGRFGGTKYFADGSKIEAPHGFKDFMKMFIPWSGGEDADWRDQKNVLGDHLGSWLAAVNIKTAGWEFRPYYEHMFEDHSQLFWEYPWKDGLFGIQIKPAKNRFITSFVYEFMTSRDQSGPINVDDVDLVDERCSGRDNYLNHFFYQGWQQGGYGIGSPIIYAPGYNTDHSLFHTTNRGRMHHIGIKGNPSDEWNYRILYTHSAHWGTYAVPFQEIKRTNSLLGEIGYRPNDLKKWEFTLSGAWDGSDFIGNNRGIRFTVRKEFNTFKF